MRFILITVAVLSLAALAPSAASAASSDTCWPAHSRGYLKSDEVRVFTLTRSVRHSEGAHMRLFYRGSYVGCNLKSRGWHYLYVDSFDAQPPLAGAIAGHFVALSVNWNCGACTSPPRSLLLRNMSSNQQWNYERHDEDAAPGFVSHGLFLGRNATLAYGLDKTTESAGTQTVTDRQIVRITVSGRHSSRSVLDSGLTVDTTSLRRDDQTLRWFNAGTAREAPFNP